MIKRLLCSAGKLLMAATCLAFAADASSAHPATICDQPFDGDLAAFAERIRHLPRAMPSAAKDRFDLQAIYVPPPRPRDAGPLVRTIWYFTPPQHPAHPAVSCMRISGTGGPHSSVDTQFHCQAAKERCDRHAAELTEPIEWAREFFEAWQQSRKPGGR